VSYDDVGYVLGIEISLSEPRRKIASSVNQNNPFTI
jgi:hypothetical protein